ncbi:hypothetical protein J3R30DRAFT_2384685 [Lentinula aciculospora]|uniref:Uncharacterized protein n=1 Tax=Lentinula aciculospora TaxID=153920 RepID=A0A9W9DQ51_9AGAR|nr:hypothetical protein J3R30DRAFT_2384685 [Lentinula aciculospora]
MYFAGSLIGLMSMATAFIPRTVSAANNYVWVRSLSSEPIDAMVSGFSTGGGDTDWFPLPTNYDDPSTSLWHRTGWELIAFRAHDNQDTTRVGFYQDFSANETFVTFYAFDAVEFSGVNPEP